jgi:hypothetical protein
MVPARLQDLKEIVVELQNVARELDEGKRSAQEIAYDLRGFADHLQRVARDLEKDLRKHGY